jgi:hypothetical protein
MSKVLCVASGRGHEWEAFCLDFDLAVSGESFEAVRTSLFNAINMYIATAAAQPEPVRKRLLARKAPLLVRLVWAWRAFWSTLSIRASRDDVPATIEFLACPA